MAVPTTSEVFEKVGEATTNVAEKAQGAIKENSQKLNLLNDKASITLKSLSEGDVMGYATNGVYDVVKDYKWTFTQSSNRPEGKIPYIQLTEYEQDLSTLYAQLAYWINNLKTTGAGKDISPYENLYHALPTGTVFKFPYYEGYDHQIMQKWGQSKGLQDFSLVEKTLQLVGAAAKALQMAPGTTVNQPRVWSGADAVTYPVTFKLFNTDSEEDIARNVDLKQRLQFSTLHDQRSAILASPPALFEVYIPGIRYSPAAVISNLAVTNVGQMNLWNGMNIPDAYEITITIAELITESRQILKAAIDGDFTKVRAITEVPKEALEAENQE